MDVDPGAGLAAEGLDDAPALADDAAHAEVGAEDLEEGGGPASCSASAAAGRGGGIGVG